MRMSRYCMLEQYSETMRCPHICGNAHTNADANTNTNTNQNPDTCSQSNPNSNKNTHSYTYENAYPVNSDQYTHPNANQNTNPKRGSDRNAYSHPNADADPYSHTGRGADGNANSNAYPLSIAGSAGRIDTRGYGECTGECSGRECDPQVEYRNTSDAVCHQDR